MSRKIKLSDYELEFIRALTEEDARYLVIGGRAVQFYAPARTTEDLDLLVGSDPENLQSVMRAMGRVDPGHYKNTWRPVDMRPGVQAHVNLQQTHADVLTSIPGVNFDTAWQQRVVRVVGGIEVSILPIDDLIKNKQADLGRITSASTDLDLLASSVRIHD